MAYRKGLNDYEIRGDITAIKVINKKKQYFEIIIDTEDLIKFQKLALAWHTIFIRGSNSYYGRCTQYLGTFDGKPKYYTIYAHQVVLNLFTDEYHIDHKNHDTLDCRKENLRVSKLSENTKSRKTKNTNNSSGYRNVTWDKSRGKWIIQLQINGKNTMMGEFDDVHEAGKVAEELRKKYYGEYAGEN